MNLFPKDTGYLPEMSEVCGFPVFHSIEQTMRSLERHRMSPSRARLKWSCDWEYVWQFRENRKREEMMAHQFDFWRQLANEAAVEKREGFDDATTSQNARQLWEIQEALARIEHRLDLVALPDDAHAEGDAE